MTDRDLDATGQQVILSLSTDSELHDDEREDLTRRLRRELLELDVDKVTAVEAAEVPSHAKADPVAIGQLLVSLSAAGGLLATLVGAVSDWLARHKDVNHISVTIAGDTIALDRATASQRTELVRTFVERHSRGD